MVSVIMLCYINRTSLLNTRSLGFDLLVKTAYTLIIETEQFLKRGL